MFVKDFPLSIRISSVFDRERFCYLILMESLFFLTCIVWKQIEQSPVVRWLEILMFHLLFSHLRELISWVSLNQFGNSFFPSLFSENLLKHYVLVCLFVVWLFCTSIIYCLESLIFPVVFAACDEYKMGEQIEDHERLL